MNDSGKKRLAGAIKNLSNTCYISSALQILLRYKPFGDLIEQICENHEELKLFSIIKNLRAEIKTSDIPIDPTPLVSYFEIDKNIQQDICEFLTKTLDTLFDSLEDKEEQRSLREILTTIINRPSSDELDSVVLYNIPVSSQSVYEGVSTCMAENNEKIENAPEMFMVQVQRMNYNKDTGVFHKVSSPIDIDLSIDLTEFGGKTYELYAVVLHIGSGNGGHYKVVLRDNEGWIEASDSNVTKSTFVEMESLAKSQLSPGYLFVYVTSLSDIDIIRGELDLSQPIIENEIPEYILREQHKERKCAFPKNTNADAIPNFSDSTNEPIYKAIFQLFDAQSMEFQDPMEFCDSKESIMSIVDTYKQQYKTSFMIGNPNKRLATIPNDFWMTAEPLYVLLERKGYRDLDIMRVDDPKMEITFEIASMRLHAQFYSSSIVADLERYVEALLRSLKIPKKPELQAKYTIDFITIDKMDAPLKSIFINEEKRVRLNFGGSDSTKRVKTFYCYKYGKLESCGKGKVQLMCPMTADRLIKEVLKGYSYDFGVFSDPKLVLFSINKFEILSPKAAVPWILEQNVEAAVYSSVNESARLIVILSTNRKKFLFDVSDCATFEELTGKISEELKCKVKISISDKEDSQDVDFFSYAMDPNAVFYVTPYE